MNRNELHAAIRHHKESGRDYYDLDVEVQQRLCAMLALTWSEWRRNEVLDKFKANDFLGHMNGGDAAEAGSLAFSLIAKEIEPALLLEWEYVEVDQPMDDEIRLDNRDRARDMGGAL